MMSMVPTFAVKLSVCINPILYIALNAQVSSIIDNLVLSLVICNYMLIFYFRCNKFINSHLFIFQFRGIFTRYILCYKIPCPKFLVKGPDSDDGIRPKTDKRMEEKDDLELNYMHSNCPNKLETIRNTVRDQLEPYC